MKLITMTDFVLEQEQYRLKNILPYPKSLSYDKILNYATFLKQPLTLGMFIPCDEEGNVLEEKSIFNTTDECYIFDSELFYNYKQAKDRVLFEGFFSNGTGNAILQQTQNALVIDMKFYKDRNVEYLLNSKCNLTLSDSAIKQLGI